MCNKNKIMCNKNYKITYEHVKIYVRVTKTHHVILIVSKTKYKIPDCQTRERPWYTRSHMIISGFMSLECIMVFRTYSVHIRFVLWFYNKGFCVPSTSLVYIMVFHMHSVRSVHIAFVVWQSSNKVFVFFIHSWYTYSFSVCILFVPYTSRSWCGDFQTKFCVPYTFLLLSVCILFVTYAIRNFWHIPSRYSSVISAFLIHPWHVFLTRSWSFRTTP